MTGKESTQVVTISLEAVVNKYNTDYSSSKKVSKDMVEDLLENWI